MEFDIGTLIYIVITIIVVIAGALGRKKKPSQAMPVASEPTEERTESTGGFLGRLTEQFEGLIEEAKEATQISTPKGPENEPVEQEVEKGYESILDQYQKFGEEAAQSEFMDYKGSYDQDQEENELLIESEPIRSADKPALDVIQLEQEDHPDYFDIIREFDLGTAVVYSTIINRKEY